MLFWTISWSPEYALGQAINSSDKVGSVWNTLGGDISVVLTDASGFFSGPLHYGISEWGSAGLGLGVIALAGTQDQEIRNMAVRNPPSGTASTVLSIGRNYGSIVNVQVFSTALYAVGLFGEDEELRVTGRMLTEGLLLAGVTRIVFGVAVGRSRPYAERGPWTFRPPGWNEERQSFPSGHAAFACVASTILSERIGHPVATGILITLAAVTGASRISDDQHWFSDVLAGGALGVLAGGYVISRERSRHEYDSGKRSGLRLIPYPDRLTLTYAF